MDLAFFLENSHAKVKSFAPMCEEKSFTAKTVITACEVLFYEFAHRFRSLSLLTDKFRSMSLLTDKFRSMSLLTDRFRSMSLLTDRFRSMSSQTGSGL